MLQPISGGAAGLWSDSYMAVLFGVIVTAQARVDVADVALQDVFEGRAKVAVEPGVDDRVEQAVRVTEPQEDTKQPWRNTRLLVVAERSDECKNEERKPAYGKCTHDDAQSLGRFALARRRCARLAVEQSQTLFYKHCRPASHFWHKLSY